MSHPEVAHAPIKMTHTNSPMLRRDITLCQKAADALTGAGLGNFKFELLPGQPHPDPLYVNAMYIGQEDKSLLNAVVAAAKTAQQAKNVITDNDGNQVDHPSVESVIEEKIEEIRQKKGK